ncbi:MULTISPECIES: NADPH-dependent FMN reductase [Psychrobacillus]|uniref:NAD(P)H-dependent oxidoreductase n=1 Tax=Psychrobacillus faecigallinarum TaxID=2762235 RepID=A0ABR8R8C9_9BACI|nr:NADPH-dependent FMN reductase [Psychrobacillus faecigallinarum]MBD7944048.1 NAD(P)H-dependent oxidoreductase [Psychrobacillus faecigallinarum]QGM31435.1 NADH-dependent FMN reductase [Bacillus sp. N3536]
MKILLVDGTIIGTKTGVLLEQVKDYIEELNKDYTLEIIKLSNYEHQFVDGRPFQQYNDDMKLLVSKFDQADGFIFATPIFQGSIPGVLKNTFDFLHPKSMRYKPVSIVANGGTFQHHLVVENQLKPILDYFKCLVTPNYVYTQTSHFDENNKIIDKDVHVRLKELARVFVLYADMSQNLTKEATIRIN